MSHMSESMPSLPSLTRGSNYSMELDSERSSSMNNVLHRNISLGDVSQNPLNRRIQLPINASNNEQPPWCGREQELQTMMNAFEQMQQQKQPTSILMEGAAGNGKTRLLTTFREQAMISDTKRIFKEAKREKWSSQRQQSSGSLISESSKDSDIPRQSTQPIPFQNPSIKTQFRRASTGDGSQSPTPQQYIPQNQPTVFCNSKFEEGRVLASQPLAPIVECFVQLTEALLSSNESRKYWKPRLSLELTNHAQTLLTVIPKLEELLFVDVLVGGTRSTTTRNSFHRTTKLTTAGASLDSSGLVRRVQQGSATRDAATHEGATHGASAFLESLRVHTERGLPPQISRPPQGTRRVRTGNDQHLDSDKTAPTPPPPLPPLRPPPQNNQRQKTEKNAGMQWNRLSLLDNPLENTETSLPPMPMPPPPSTTQPQKEQRPHNTAPPRFFRKSRIQGGTRRNHASLLDNSQNDESSSLFFELGGRLEASENGAAHRRASYRLSTKLVRISSQSAQEQRRSAEKIRFALRELLRSVSRELPVVFTIEDVQRTGPESVAMLRALLADQYSISRRFLFVVTFRPLEATHPFQNMIQTLGKLSKESRAITKPYTVALSALTEANVLDLVSKLLHREREDVRELAALIFSKTAGNAFFVVEFVRLLDKKELVNYSVINCQWEWVHLSKISAVMETSVNVVDLLAEKIRSASQDVKLALLTAAAFGVSLFSAQTIFKAIPGESDGANQLIRRASTEVQMKQKTSSLSTLEALICVLEEAVDEGYVEPVGSFKYKFTHDRVREAAMTLLPLGVDLNMLRLRIGRQLHSWLRQLDQEGIDDESVLIQVVVLLNPASYLIQDNAETLDLIELNYRAAERAIQRSSFFPASDFLRAAINLLGDDDSAWNNNYAMMMKLSDGLMRMDYCCGRLASSMDIADQILNMARSFDDKKMAYHMKILWLTQIEKIDESLDLILSVLEELGAPVPQHFLRLHRFLQYRRIRLDLSGKSDMELLSLPPSSDPRIEDVGSFMEQLEEVASNRRNHNNLLEVALLRKVELTIHERFTMTPSCLVSWGVFHARNGRFDEAHRFGKLGVQLANEGGGGYHDARAILMYHMYIFHWRTPYHDGIRATSDALKRLWDMGAIEYVFLDTITYLLIYFCCGLRLTPLAYDIRKYVDLIGDYGKNVSTHKHLSFFQCIANLIEDQSGDRESESGDRQSAFVEGSSELDGLGSLLEDKDRTPAPPRTYFYRMMLLYFFNDIGAAVSMANQIASPLEEGSDVTLLFRVFFLGMTYLSSFITTRNFHQRRKGLAMIAQMQRWEADGVVNAHHMRLLLRAEHRAGTRKAFNKVRRFYDNAIANSGRLGCLHTHALGNERCALFCLRRGEEEWSRFYFKKALSLYQEWGATAKAHRMKQEYGKFLPGPQRGMVSSQGTTIKSVSRLGSLSRDSYK